MDTLEHVTSADPPPTFVSCRVALSLELLMNVSIYFLAQKLAAQTFQRTVGGMPFLSLRGGWLPFILVYPAFALVANCGCQNGGICVSYKYFSSIRRCNCPKRFQGEHCEIGMAVWTLSWEGGRIRDFRAGEDGREAEAEETGPGGVGL